MKLLLIITAICLIISLLWDLEKIWQGLKRGIQMFLRILPTILSVIIVVSILLSLVPEQKMVVWFGDKSGIGVYIAAVLIGSISLIQGFFQEEKLVQALKLKGVK